MRDKLRHRNLEGGKTEKNILPATFLEAFRCADQQLRFSLNQFISQFTMAAVYKSVSKKQAKQLAREQEQDDSDAEMAEMADLLADADDTSDSEDEEEEDLESAKKQLAAGYMPKTRVLMLTSRGVTSRYVHIVLVGIEQKERYC